MPQLRTRVDQGAMAMKGYSTFQHYWKLTIRLLSVQDTHWCFLPLYREAVSVFFSLSRLGQNTIGTVTTIRHFSWQLKGENQLSSSLNSTDSTGITEPPSSSFLIIYRSCNIFYITSNV